MLLHTGNNVAMDSYGPITDNANGIGEMAWHDMEDEETIKARQIMADLDAVGNTTKAITKGVAIASAVIAAVSLFGSFITDVAKVQANLLSLSESIRDSERRCLLAFSWGVSSLVDQLPFHPGCYPSAVRMVRTSANSSIFLALWKALSNPIIARVVEIPPVASQKNESPCDHSIALPLLLVLSPADEALGGFPGRCYPLWSVTCYFCPTLVAPDKCQEIH